MDHLSRNGNKRNPAGESERESRPKAVLSKRLEVEKEGRKEGKKKRKEGWGNLAKEKKISTARPGFVVYF